MASAAAQVFDTCELLKRTLLKLSMKQLFVLQRTGRTWKQLISRSRPLQKKMFLMADGRPVKPESLSLDTDPGLQATSGRHRYANGHIHFNSVAACHVNDAPMEEHHFTMPVEDVNFLFQVRPRSSRYLLTKHFHAIVMLESHTLMSTTRSKMYITQSPVTAVSFIDCTALPSSGKTVSCTIWNPNGITFGQLFEICDSIHSAIQSPDLFSHGIAAAGMEINLPFCDSVRQRLLDSCSFWTNNTSETNSGSGRGQTSDEVAAESQASSDASSGEQENSRASRKLCALAPGHYSTNEMHLRHAAC